MRNVVAWAVKPVEEGGLGARAVVVNVSSLRLAFEFGVAVQQGDF